MSSGIFVFEVKCKLREMNTNFRPMWDRGGFRGGRGGPNRRGRGGNRGSFRFGGHNVNNYIGHRGGYSRGDFGANYGQGGSNSAPQWMQPKRETPGKRLSEDAIGVTEYISDHPGFNGIIKSRYSAFYIPLSKFYYSIPTSGILMAFGSIQY